MKIPRSMLLPALEGNTDAQAMLADYLKEQGCSDFVADECYFHKIGGLARGIVQYCFRTSNGYGHGIGTGIGVGGGIGGGIGGGRGAGRGSSQGRGGGIHQC